MLIFPSLLLMIISSQVIAEILDEQENNIKVFLSDNMADETSIENPTHYY